MDLVVRTDYLVVLEAIFEPKHRRDPFLIVLHTRKALPLQFGNFLSQVNVCLLFVLWPQNVYILLYLAKQLFSVMLHVEVANDAL